MPHTWNFPARATRIVDGDTLDLEIDVGFRLRARHRIRLFGVNTPERRGSTRAAGDAALDFVARWCARQGSEVLPADRYGRIPLGPCEGFPLVVHTEEADAFGRYLGVVTLDGESLADALLAAGLAVPYRG